jgi:glyoxylase-like metal-dependent hydrolase (beta-lactamase superfamily II)
VTLAALATAGLGPEDLTFVVVTHVHLDHAGAAGALASAFPAATVLVHPAGARHLADPSRLVASAARVHGPLMDSVYGVMDPVPADRVRALDDDTTLDLGGGRVLRVLHTPGHANHHLSLLDEATGALYPGDAAGIQVAPMRLPRPSTPPPDFDAATAMTSLHRMRSLHPDRLLLTHFGAIDDAAGYLAHVRERLERWCAVARASPDPGDPAVVEQELMATFAAEEGIAELDPARFAVFGGYAANAAGLSRWAARGPASRWSTC